MPLRDASSGCVNIGLCGEFLQRLPEHFGMPVHIFRFRLRRNQRNIMKRRQQDSSIHGVEVHESFQLKIHRVVGLFAVGRLLGAKKIFGPAPQTSHVPGKFRICNGLGHAHFPTLGHRNHPVKGLFGKNFRQCGAHGRERKRVPGEGASDPAHIAVFEFLFGDDAFGNFLRKAISRAGNASPDGLAEDEDVRLETLRSRITPRSRADRVRLVDDEQGPMLASEFAQGSVISRLRMHDADVRHSWLC